MSTYLVVQASADNFLTTVQMDKDEPVKIESGESHAFELVDDKTQEVQHTFTVSTSYQGDPLDRNDEYNPNKADGPNDEPTESEKAGNPGLADRNNK